MESINKVKILLRVEGIFYLLTGLWPLLHLGSYQRVTGFKTDLWMVVTVGALLALYGLSFLMESRNLIISKAIMALGIAAPLILLWIDVYYVYSGVISPIYIVDALIENLLVLSWLIIIISK